MKPFKTLLPLTIVFLGLSLWGVSRSSAETYETDALPWSGYWWPSIHGGLATGKDYRGHPAPLEKYDQLIQGVFPGLSTQWYAAKYYDTSALSWFGLCWNWAMSATFEDIDFFPSSENNIHFRVGDKKGILTAANTDNAYEYENGASPASFHYWLLNYIQDQGRAFVADLDPTGELWSYPVFRFDMTSSVKSGGEAVAVTIHYADDMVAPDYMGTQVRRKTYTYTLGITGDGSISGGQWTGASIADHPQGMWFVLDAASATPYLDYNRAVQIARSADDFLETGGPEPAPVAPGTYNLVLMNEDAYRIDCGAGDTVSLSLKRLSGSASDMLVSVRDAQGADMGSYRISAYKYADSAPVELTLSSGTPPYILTFGQDSYRDPNLYVLTLDIDKTFQQTVPYIPSFMWSGFAVTNPTGMPVSNVFLTSYGSDGAPIHTGFGPVTLAPGEKRVFLLDQLPWRRHEFSRIDRLILKSDGFLNFVNLFGDKAGLAMASFNTNPPRSGRLILPGAVTTSGTGEKIFSQILSESGGNTGVTMKLYSPGGAFLKQAAATIPAGRKYNIQPGKEPFQYSMSNTDWVDVTSSAGALMSGFQYVSAAGKAEVMPMESVAGSAKVVPHIPPASGSWILTVALINPNDAENRVRFHMKKAGQDAAEDMEVVLGPREKRLIDIQSHFARFPGHPLHQSMIGVTGDLPFVGWYSYGTPGGGEEASFPLIDDADNTAELILPHNAGTNGGAWWTGACVGNASGVPLTVWVEPYGRDGGLISHQVRPLSLDPGAYEILTAAGFFGEFSNEIAFVKFRVDPAADGRICGFYLYGKLENGVPTTRQLSGGNMGGADIRLEDLPPGAQLVRGGAPGSGSIIVTSRSVF
ncbi:hypothetical protein [Desulfococcus sp.]|uniref:hypothetical protein n=1 Tax=Desulfococcus sp. TaxID=2025834 RepID=UPI003593545E